MSNIDKIAKINLENKPYVKPISNVDIGFYNLDNGTAKLQFVITRDGFPMQMGPVNVTGYLWLKSTNGSMSGQLNLEIIDGLNGVVGVTIPNWFLVGATNTTVSGQIILAVNENTDIATLGEFSFKVADTIPNQIKGEIKVQYFRMFDDMKQALEDRVHDFETRFDNLDELIVNVESTVANGISQIKTSVTNAEKNVGDIKTQANSEIKNASNQAVTDVNTAKDSAISTMNSKVDESINKVSTTSTGAIEHVDGKILEFNTHIEENSFVQPTDLDNKLNELQWQKYKLTNDDGTYPMININNDLELYHNLNIGNYYTTNTPISGIGATSTAGFTEVREQSPKTVKHMTFRPYNSSQIFTKYFYNTWSEWKLINIPQSDTGWIPFQLINGALSNTAYKGVDDRGFDCAYRTITNGTEVIKKLRINGTNLTPNQVIAQLPSNFAKNTQAFPVRVPNSSAGGYVVIRPNGQVNFYVPYDTSKWNETGYAYGECTWHD
ncbi:MULTISPECIES: BppU family phage baseplate upper protein [Mammaliicoccus]|uniref:BppU family phage baseplate upper protein n=1 Tax=Mammaliicoccus sciuri TaxID=1296 RepID=A0AAW5LQL4_MAMSC|nr:MULTISPECIES: BppU family phage baseplate upper protein [Mammaliicoccus]MCQ9305015.1 BppU family phage baseplate upper protein [Mammaliicoccus sciuri]